jgi:zinc protease
MGYPETVEKLTRDDLVKAYRETYVPNNMVITVVGNFNEKKLIVDLTNALGTIKKGSALQRVPGEIPDHSVPVEKVETRDTAASWFSLGWTAPSLTNPDYYPMEMLDAVTGGSMNSRLFVAVREQRGLAYQVSSFLNSRMETGLYAAYIGTKPETYQESRKVLLDEIYRLKSESVTDEELNLAKSYLRGMYIMGQESNAGQASQYAQYETLGVGYNYGDKYVTGIEKVTASDIVRVAGKYLVNGYSFGGVLPKAAK